MANKKSSQNANMSIFFVRTAFQLDFLLVDIGFGGPPGHSPVVPWSFPGRSQVVPWSFPGRFWPNR